MVHNNPELKTDPRIFLHDIIVEPNPVFDNPRDLLTEVKTLVKTTPNDMELGEKIRELINNYEKTNQAA